jgi:uncharacterized protein (DUF2344 family)
MTTENQLSVKEVERLKKLLDLFPRDADVEDAAKLIQDAKSVMRAFELGKYVFNLATVGSAMAVAWWKWKSGAGSE